MPHSSAKLLWKQIQGHIRLAHQNSPEFPHSLNILSLCFFTSMKWKLCVCFREGNVLFKVACWHHEFYMTEAPSHNILKPLLISQQGSDPAARRCGISHQEPWHGGWLMLFTSISLLPVTTTETQPALKHRLRDLPGRQICCISSPSQCCPQKSPPTQAVWRYTDVSRWWASLAEHPICCKASGGRR